MTRLEIKIAGYGGNGVITLGKLITVTAILHCKGLTAAQSESYGAAARGGACWTEVIIDDENKIIDYPRSIPGNTDIAVFFSNPAAKQYASEVKRDNGIIIYDPKTVDESNFSDYHMLYKIPAQDIAKELIKNPLTANVVIFGAICALLDKFSYESAKETVINNVPKKVIDVNLLAFNAGYSYMNELKNKKVAVPISINN